MVVFGKRQDLMPKLAEFIEAIKGRRSMYMSRGLAELVGLKEENDDEAQFPKREVVYAFDDMEWLAFCFAAKLGRLCTNSTMACQLMKPFNHILTNLSLFSS